MMTKLKSYKFLFAALALVALVFILRAPANVAAQDAQGAPDQMAPGATADDPPTRVARLNLVQGSVSFQPSGGGDNDWVTAELNRPLTTGDQLWSDSDGLVEMHVGSTAVRLDHNTGVSFLTLSDNLIQFQVSAGSVVVRLRQLDPNDAFEIDAPNLAFSLMQPGTYQVSVDPDQSVTVVTVVNGEGQVTGGGRSWNITPDQQATFTGTDTLNYSLDDADSLPQTDFQNWSAQRDAAEDRMVAPQYVSPETTGYEDLDTYGDWSAEADYGTVWFPRGVEMGWAPYRLGHWVWISPWGWTWVDSEPWGFAPFHYGRWAVFGGRWGWVPGPVVVGVRPCYAPALVAWVGGAPGFSFSVAIGGGGGIGWFPLGPREVFMPAYHVSQRYMTRVNVTNTVVDRTTVLDVYHNNSRNVTYVNQHVEGGVTVVSHDTFVGGGMVARNVVNVSARDLANAPVDRGGPAAEPVRASVVGAEARPAEHRPPANVVSRTTVTVRTPAQPQTFHGNGAAPPGGNAPENMQRQDEGNPQGNAPNYRPGNNRSPATTNEPNGNAPAMNQPDRNVPPTNEPNRSAPPVTQPNRTEAAPPAPVAPAPPANSQARDDGGNTGRNNDHSNDRNNANVSNAPPPEPANRTNVRPAPPVRQPTPDEQQSDADKQQQWQAKHQEVHQSTPPPSGGAQNNHASGGQSGKPSEPKPPHR
jgi:hypothetical protein